MKLADAPIDHTPPRVVTLAPTAFCEAWSKRPRGPIQVGLRRLSADEYLHAQVEAARLTSSYLPDVGRDEDLWAEVYDVLYFHQLLAYALTDPKDARAPLWNTSHGGAQDAGQWTAKQPRHDSLGDLLISTRNPSEVIAATRFTSEGFGRLFDEFSILRIKDSPVWPEADDEDIQRFGAGLADGSLLGDLEAGPRPGEDAEAVDRRHALAGELRRLLSFVIDTHDNGFTRPDTPPPHAPSPAAGRAA